MNSKGFLIRIPSECKRCCMAMCCFTASCDIADLRNVANPEELMPAPEV